MQRNITYNEINVCVAEEQLPIINGYCYVGNQQFYGVCKPEFEQELSQHAEISALNTHWKAHLSCAQHAIPKLWEIVVPLLVQHDCPAFKCIRLCNISDEHKSKLFGTRCVDALQFTIYIAPGEEEKYTQVLNQIETLLIANDIAKCNQTHFLDSDKRIGIYTSVRHSRGLDGKYLSAEAAYKLHSQHPDKLVYNFAGVPDPFQEMESLKNMRAAEQQARANAPRTSMWQLAQLAMKEKEQKANNQANQQLPTNDSSTFRVNK